MVNLADIVFAGHVGGACVDHNLLRFYNQPISLSVLPSSIFVGLILSQVRITLIRSTGLSVKN